MSSYEEQKGGRYRAFLTSLLALTFITILLVLDVALSRAQSNTQPKPSFEVASIKLNTSGVNPSTNIKYQPGGRLLATNCPFSVVVAFAYGLESSYQIQKGPNWTRSDRWDIDARAGGREVPKQDVMALMLQSLLEDRFKLKLHRGAQELPVYVVTIAKGGLKMKLSKTRVPLNH